MVRRICSKSELSVVCFMAFAMLALALPAHSMTISPHRIVLNAKCDGQNTQDIQAIIRQRNDAIMKVVDWDVKLFLVVDEDEDVEIADAFEVRYCWTDGNFLISFDRSEVQTEVQDFANQVVTVKVEGWFEALKFGGGSIIDDLSGKAQVEIVSPSKK
jgi:hypothetical protein